MDFNQDFLSQKNESHIPIPPKGTLVTPNENQKKQFEAKRTESAPVQKKLTNEQIEVLNSQKRDSVIVLAGIKKASDYSEYKALDDNQLKSLDATNYWRVMDGMSFINVPLKDNHFWHYFDERCFGLAKQHQISTKDFKEQKRIREEFELSNKAESEKLTVKSVKENKIADWVNTDLKAVQEPPKNLTTNTKQVKKMPEKNSESQQNLF